MESLVDGSDFPEECRSGWLVVENDFSARLTKPEQLKYALQCTGRNPSDKTVGRYWSQCGGSMSFEQFSLVMKRERKTTISELMKAFRKIDLNGDGFITTQELHKTLTKRGEKMSHDEVQAIIDEADQNGDGKLDYVEFSHMLINTSDQCLKASMQTKTRKTGFKSSQTGSKTGQTSSKHRRDRSRPYPPYQRGDGITHRDRELNSQHISYGNVHALKGGDGSHNYYHGPVHSRHTDGPLSDGSALLTLQQQQRIPYHSGKEGDLQIDEDLHLPTRMTTQGVQKPQQLQAASNGVIESSLPSSLDSVASTAATATETSLSETSRQTFEVKRTPSDAVNSGDKMRDGTKLSVGEKENRRQDQEGVSATNAASVSETPKSEVTDTLTTEASGSATVASNKSTPTESDKSDPEVTRKREEGSKVLSDPLDIPSPSLTTKLPPLKKTTALPPLLPPIGGGGGVAGEEVKKVEEGGIEARKKAKKVEEGGIEARKKAEERGVAEVGVKGHSNSGADRDSSGSNGSDQKLDQVEPQATNSSKSSPTTSTTIQQEHTGGSSKPPKATDQEAATSTNAPEQTTNHQASQEGNTSSQSSTSSDSSKDEQGGQKKKEEGGDQKKEAERQTDHLHVDKGEKDGETSSSSVVQSKEETKKTTTAAPPSSVVAMSPKKPKNLKSWNSITGKGCFYLDQEEDDTDDITDDVADKQEVGVVKCHHYRLKLPSPTNVWIEMGVAKPGILATDVQLFVFRTNEDEELMDLITYTQHKVGEHWVCRLDLEAGTYALVPFTSGCHLKPREEDKVEVGVALLSREGQGGVVFTDDCREALEEIFHRMDLDSNGFLGRTEFDFFQERTAGEICDDESWKVIQDNFEMTDDDELTLKGFIDLHVMTAEDEEGGEGEVWEVLEALGYNRHLQLDQACPFMMDVYTEDCEGEIEIVDLLPFDAIVEPAFSQLVVDRGVCEGVRDGGGELNRYTFTTPHITTIVVENKSSKRVSVQLDVSKSTNTVFSRESSVHVLEIPPNECKVGFHLLPEDPDKSYSINCIASKILC